MEAIFWACSCSGACTCRREFQSGHTPVRTRHINTICFRYKRWRDPNEDGGHFTTESSKLRFSNIYILRDLWMYAIPSIACCMLGRSPSRNYLSCAPGEQALTTPGKDKVRDPPATASHEKDALHYCALPPASLFAPVYRLSLSGKRRQSLRRARVHHPPLLQDDPMAVADVIIS